MALGENLRKLREDAHLTQQQLADRLYVSRQTISRWESGSRCPDLIMAKKLAMELNISVDELISDEEIKDMSKNLYFWRGPQWEEKRKLKELQNSLYKLLDVIGTIFLVIMIFLLWMKTRVPIWCTVTTGVMVIAIRILIFVLDKRMSYKKQ